MWMQLLRHSTSRKLCAAGARRLCLGLVASTKKQGQHRGPALGSPLLMHSRCQQGRGLLRKWPLEDCQSGFLQSCTSPQQSVVVQAQRILPGQLMLQPAGLAWPPTSGHTTCVAGVCCQHAFLDENSEPGHALSIIMQAEHVPDTQRCSSLQCCSFACSA